jgi:hypothetical protein
MATEFEKKKKHPSKIDICFDILDGNVMYQ